MDERKMNDPGENEKDAPDERPATSNEDEEKTGMHRPGGDPLKQIPAKEGGET
jgi:hypothetical protein